MRRSERPLIGSMVAVIAAAWVPATVYWRLGRRVRLLDFSALVAPAVLLLFFSTARPEAFDGLSFAELEQDIGVLH